MRTVLAVLVALMLTSVPAAEAYRWRLTPGCASLDLTFNPLSPHLFAVAGARDYRACGAGDLIPGQPVVGLAVIDEETVTLSLAIGYTIGTAIHLFFSPVDLLATLNMITARGEWRVLGADLSGKIEPE